MLGHPDYKPIRDARMLDKLRSAPVIGKDVSFPAWLHPYNSDELAKRGINHFEPLRFKYLVDHDKLNLPFNSARFGNGNFLNKIDQEARAHYVHTDGNIIKVPYAVADTDDMSKKPKKACLLYTSPSPRDS